MPKIIVGVRIKPENDINLSKSINFSNSNTSRIDTSSSASLKTNRSTPTPRNHSNSIDISIGEMKYDFHYDHLFLSSTSQEKIFEDCAIPIISNALDGINGTIMTYGQTGAGKTYTMTGPSIDSDIDQQGLVIRTSNYILEQSKLLINTNDSILLRLSILEIYNETLIDLLNDNSITNPISTSYKNNNIPSQINNKLSIIETVNGVTIPALYTLPISTEFDTFSFLLQAMNNRNICEHQLNKSSSRSHVIYTFYITKTKQKSFVELPSDITSETAANDEIVDYDMIQSKLHLVDLAGSERVEKTGSNGIVQKEASYINRSLSYLEQVVLALSQSKRDHIPFRQSKLTLILKDSFNGLGNTYLLACIWPHHNFEYETLSTLRFATRMKGIKNHPIKNSIQNINSNKENDKEKKLFIQIENLKKQIIEKNLIIEKMKNSTNEKSNFSTIEPNNISINIPNQLPQVPNELTKMSYIKAFKISKLLVNENPKISNISTNLIDNIPLIQIKQILNFLRNFLWDSCNYDEKKIQKVILSINNQLNNSFLQLIENENKNVIIENKNSSIRNNILSAKKLDKQIDKQIDEQDNNYEFDSPNNNNFNNQFDEPIDNPFDSPSETLSSMLSTNLSPNESSPMKTFMSFDEYTEGPGKQLNDVYLDIKENIKINKQKQKQLIQSINLTKSQIDKLVGEIKYLNGKKNVQLSNRLIDSQIDNKLNSDIDSTINIDKDSNIDTLLDNQIDDNIVNDNDIQIDNESDIKVDNAINEILDNKIETNSTVLIASLVDNNVDKDVFSILNNLIDTIVNSNQTDSKIDNETNTKIDSKKDNKIDNEIVNKIDETIINPSNNDLSIDKLIDKPLHIPVDEPKEELIDGKLETMVNEQSNNDIIENTSIYPTVSKKPIKPKLVDNFLSMTVNNNIDSQINNKIDNEIENLDKKLNELTNQLNINKKTYNLLKEELENCKIQLTDDNNKKKQVINQLLENYQNYCNNMNR